MTTTLTTPDVLPFDRRFFDGSEQFTRIGSGAFGGKAHGLLGVKELLATVLEAQLGAREAARLRRHFAVHVGGSFNTARAVLSTAISVVGDTIQTRRVLA